MQRTTNRLSIFLFFGDIFIILLGFYTAMQIRILLPFGGPYGKIQTQLPVIIYGLAIGIWSLSLILVEAYHPQKVLRAIDELRRVLFSSVIAVLAIAGTLYFTYRDLSRYQFIYFALATTFLLLFYRMLLRIYYRLRGYKRGGRRRRILIVGAGELGIRVAETILKQSRWGFELIGLLDDDPEKLNLKPEGLEGKSVLGSVDQLVGIVNKYEISDIYLALPSRAYKKLQNTVAILQTMAVRINIVPDYMSLALVHARSDVMGGLPVIHLRAPVIAGTNRLVKRMFDLIISVLLLIFIWPILLFVAVWIRLDSPGPAVFRQQRVGENGVLFTMFKFRTMDLNAEERQQEITHLDEEGNIIHKSTEDPRVTRLGRFLRRTSLDELPQVFNVIKGDMSLVGPRPEMPWLVEKYEPWQRKRFAVPQGVTGWWQVNKREEGIMHLGTKDDLYYVYNYSLWLDIKILFMTFGALFRGY